jgi:hypothetical protein
LLIFQNIVRFKAGGKAKAGAFAYAWGKRRGKGWSLRLRRKKWLYEPSEWGYQ